MSEFTQGLRELADFLDTHPELSKPNHVAVDMFVHDGPETPRKVALSLKPCLKIHLGNFFILRRSFGPLNLDYVWNRRNVCTARVVGTERVPERITAAYDREIIEWDCPQILDEELE